MRIFRECTAYLAQSELTNKYTSYQKCVGLLHL